jgi:hypothetical protein
MDNLPFLHLFERSEYQGGLTGIRSQKLRNISGFVVIGVRWMLIFIFSAENVASLEAPPTPILGGS